MALLAVTELIAITVWMLLFAALGYTLWKTGQR